VAEESGWSALNEPGRTGREELRVSPFNRLARVHAASAAGDVVVAVALAGSLFFSIDPGQARWRVGLYLLLTLAPFAVVAPLIGPLIDRARGGSRWVIVATGAGRVVVGYLMMRHLDGLLLFPEAFLMLVLAKSYSVAKTAYVPATVRDDAELVSANAKLALLAALAGPAAALPAGLLHVVLGSRAVVAFAALLFVVTTVLAFRLEGAADWSLAHKAMLAARADGAGAASRDGDAGAAPDGAVGAVGAAAPRRPGPGPNQGLWLAASAMGLLRGSVGFLAFLLAFELRSKSGSAAGYGVVLLAAGAGNLVGAVLAPRLRLVLREDQMLGASLVAATVVAAVAAFVGDMFGAVTVVAGLGLASGTAKLAFDALAQRDAPTAEKGRLLAQFEARFQMLWVIGAFIPVVLPIPAQFGYLLIAVLVGAGAASFILGRRSLGSMVSQLAWGPSGRPPPARGRSTAATSRRGGGSGLARSRGRPAAEGRDRPAGRSGVAVPPPSS
jgi:Transmembrane secretion effector